MDLDWVGMDSIRVGWGREHLTVVCGHLRICACWQCEWWDIALGSPNCSPLGTLLLTSISTYLCRITKLLVIITIQHFPHLQFPFSLEPISAYRAPSLNFCEFILIFLGLSSHHWTEIPPKKCWTFLAICLYPDFFTKSWRGISLSKYNKKLISVIFAEPDFVPNLLVYCFINQIYFYSCREHFPFFFLLQNISSNFAYLAWLTRRRKQTSFPSSFKIIFLLILAFPKDPILNFFSQFHILFLFAFLTFGENGRLRRI